jgi:glycine/D-amino acid oxidase-like deaminating enzyme
MSGPTYDAIIIGAGLMGASTAAALATAGKSVVVLDAQERGHELGSSHGYSRVTRTLSSEAKVFPETAAASLNTMHEMEKRPGVGPIVKPMPALFFVKSDSPGHAALVRDLKSRRSDVVQWTDPEMVQPYGLILSPGEVALIDNQAAVFNPSKVLNCLYEDIEKAGSEIRFGCRVVRWSTNDDEAMVTTTDHSVVHGRQLVIATGGWTPEVANSGSLENDFAERLCKEMILLRVPVFYFDCPLDLSDAISLTVLDDGAIDMYAMPEFQPDGRKLLKMGFHTGDKVSHPSEVDGSVSEDEKSAASDCLQKRFHKHLRFFKHAVCLYAMKENDRPFVGRLPGTRNVYLSTYGGGNCAKHAPALGDTLSSLMRAESILEEFRPD